MTVYIGRMRFPGNSGTYLHDDTSKAVNWVVSWLNEARRIADLPQDATPDNWRGKQAELALVSVPGRVYSFELYAIEEHELDQFAYPRTESDAVS